MRSCLVAVGILTACLSHGTFTWAQADGQLSGAPASSATVPRLIRISGAVRDEAGRPLTGNTGIRFTLYRDQTDEEGVWQEKQTVELDAGGRYSVLLGATNEAGLPLEIFSAGEARWLGVRPEGQMEQARILFLSVAYALKAADSEMLGGRPASAYVLAGTPNPSAAGAPAVSGNAQNGAQAIVGTSGLPLLVSPQTACAAITSDGTATANQVAKFTAACNIENSAIFESGGNVGIGTTSPGGVLDVAGTAIIRGSLSLQQGMILNPVGTATASQSYASGPLDLAASAYNTSSSSAVNYLFRWQATGVGNDTPSPGAELDLFYGVPGFLLPTGLSIAKSGIITFASGQTFPGGSGSGTVTSVGTGAGLTGGPITTSGTISIPSAGVTNSMLANNSVKVVAGSGLSGGGTVALGGSVTLTGNISGTPDGVAYFSSPSSVVSTAAPTNGQILIGSTGNAPVLSTLTAGPNVTITNGAGTVTISASGGGGGGTILPYFATGDGRTGAKQAATANVTKLWGFLLPYNVTTRQISYDVVAVDKTANDYDIGIYNSAGNLVVDVGATPGTTFAPSSGFQTLAWIQGSTSLAPGEYYLGFTTNCTGTCAKVAAATGNISFALNVSSGATTGGVLPASITPPANKWATGDEPSVVIQ